MVNSVQIVGNYGIVENEVMRNPSIPLAAKGLYCILASYAGDKDYCFPSRKTLMREAGITKDTLTRHLQTLIDAGYVTKERYYPGSDGKFKNNSYTLCLRLK